VTFFFQYTRDNLNDKVKQSLKHYVCIRYVSSRALCPFIFHLWEELLSYYTAFSLTRQNSRELIDRFFYALRFPSRDYSLIWRARQQRRCSRSPLRIAGVRIIAYYRSFIGRHTIAIHSLCCLALWCRLLCRRSFSVSSDFVLFKRDTIHSTESISLSQVANKCSTNRRNRNLPPYISFFLPFPSLNDCRSRELVADKIELASFAIWQRGETMRKHLRKMSFGIFGNALLIARRRVSFDESFVKATRSVNCLSIDSAFRWLCN